MKADTLRTKHRFQLMGGVHMMLISFDFTPFNLDCRLLFHFLKCDSLLYVNC